MTGNMLIRRSFMAKTAHENKTDDAEGRRVKEKRTGLTQDRLGPLGA